MSASPNKVGLWLIGACGGVGSTVALGIAALGKGLADTTGLVSELPPFKPAELVDPGSIAFGGHEVRSESLLDAARASHARANLFTETLIKSCAPKLRAMQSEVKSGTLYETNPAVRDLADRPGIGGESCPAEVIERLAADIVAFRRKRKLDHVVVVNVASSEPPVPLRAAHRRYTKLQKALAQRGSHVLPASSLYALAAIEARCPYVNFTPSLGVSVAAIQERAAKLNVPYMGNDGKTGETLIKTVLAPMFALRNLSVLSWVGYNILGNRDGAALNDPDTRASKLRSKDKSLTQLLGGSPTTRVSIDYIPSLDDWKVAWDFIHFEGFLGTKMSMQFTWHGSDSVLAAPLIIDLARLAALASHRGAAGPMKHLACFFKDPIAVEDQSLLGQWQLLLNYISEEPDAQD